LTALMTLATMNRLILRGFLSGLSLGGFMKRGVVSGLAVSAIGAALALSGYAQQARTVAQGVYSAAQAGRGQTAYTANCALCHGPELKGAVGPMLTGDGFTSAWAGRPLSDLVDKIENTMPPQAPGSTTPAQAIDIAAYILQFEKFSAGQAELSAANLSGIVFPGTRPATGATAGGVALVPTANLAQLMRGVTFYNANVLFNVQVKDPGGPKPGPPVPFDYVLWGQSNYYGWQAVDQAALALIETTPLFLVPGRRCENGQPAPVERADFKQYAGELIELSREFYKAAQTRNPEAVSDMAERLDMACANCHRIYRDAATEGAVRADKCLPLTPAPAR
jgi:mono/diheme cytochrome c family protein